MRALICCALLAAAAAAQDVRDLKERMAAARARVFPTLVHIMAVEEVFSGGERQKSVSTGSGFFIDEKGHVVTNFHVAGQAHRLYVTLASKHKVDAELVAGDPYTDLAVLRVDPKIAFPDGKPVFARFGTSATLREGDFVMAMGSPLSLSRSVSFGIISCRDRLLGSIRVAGHDTGKYNTWLQTDAAINPGNSGGPLVSLAGEVIGVNTRANLGANNIGFAIPSDVVKEVVAALLEHKTVPRSDLGLKLQPLESVENTVQSVKEGALVAAVESDSPAEAAGIRPGDFVTRLNGAPFSARFAEEVPALYRRISKLPRDKPSRLTVVRRAQTMELELTAVALHRDVGKERQLKSWGITVRAITPRMMRRDRLPDTSGVEVTGVRPGSPAAGRLGARDIIRSVQGRPVADLDAFLKAATESIARRDKLVRFVLRRSSVTDVCAIRPRYDKKDR